MASRLSETSLIESYDTGFKAFAMPGADSYTLIPVDFKGILTSKNPKAAIQALPPQQLLTAMFSRGLSDCVEILPLISQDQWQRITDYDTWVGDSLSLKQTMGWLKLFKEVSPKLMVDRFRELEECQQIGLLSNYVRVFDQEGYDSMTPGQQDSLQRFPGDAMYYSVLSDDPEIVGPLQEFMEAAMAEDMGYSMALVAQSALNPPGEQELLALQFRNARLEEDGFVPESESQQLFYPLPETERIEPMDSSDEVTTEPLTAVASAKAKKSFWQQTLEQIRDPEARQNIQTSMLFLANSLCSIGKVEVDDRAGLRLILENCLNTVSLGLDFLSGGDAGVAARLLQKHYPKGIFRNFNNYLLDLRLEYLKELQEQGLIAKTASANLLAGRYGVVLDSFDKQLIDVLGIEAVEVLKGMFNRFPLVSIGDSLQADTTKSERQRRIFHPCRSLAEFKMMTAQVEAILLLCRFFVGSRTLSDRSIADAQAPAKSTNTRTGNLRLNFFATCKAMLVGSGQPAQLKTLDWKDSSPLVASILSLLRAEYQNLLETWNIESDLKANKREVLHWLELETKERADEFAEMCSSDARQDSNNMEKILKEGVPC